VRRTFLLGKGLSLAFNADHYRLAALTERVRERLAGMALRMPFGQRDQS